MSILLFLSPLSVPYSPDASHKLQTWETLLEILTAKHSAEVRDIEGIATAISLSLCLCLPLSFPVLPHFVCLCVCVCLHNYTNAVILTLKYSFVSCLQDLMRKKLAMVSYFSLGLYYLIGNNYFLPFSVIGFFFIGIWYCLLSYLPPPLSSLVAIFCCSLTYSQTIFINFYAFGKKYLNLAHEMIVF